jgi:hypothetical protein
MVLHQRSVFAVVLLLNGGRSGPKIGKKLNIAAIDAGKINEANYLYPL